MEQKQLNKRDSRYREVERLLLVTASSEAGRSQEAVDPVGNATVKYEVSLDDLTLPIIDEDFSLVKKKTTSWTTDLAVSGSASLRPPQYSRCLPSPHS